ncbi:hypothetical protein Droror1_Dr00003389 [Drosera rotundifolia]
MTEPFGHAAKPKPILVCLVTLLSCMLSSSEEIVHHFKLSVEYMFWSPDCKESVVIGINGQFPGPTIRAHAGDIIWVDLTNKLPTEGVVIHWHGIKQIGSPWADGTASISQCAISPGETFTYRFKVDKAGTYFYHGHYGLQRSAGLYGLLIVDVAEGDKEPFLYDGEFSLLLSDWWHQNQLEMEVGLSSLPFRWIGEPQSLLLNGRGTYKSSLLPDFGNKWYRFEQDDDCAPEIINVLPNKTYRLRLASTTSLASLNVAIGNHKMLVAEADGNYVQPFFVDDLDIYSGETYSILVTTDQNPMTNYWLSVGVRGREPHTPPALTMLSYHSASSELPLFLPPPIPLWNNHTHSKLFSKRVLAAVGSPRPPRTSERRIILLNTQNKINGHFKWAINNVSLVLPHTPLLGSIKFGLQQGFDHKNPPDNFTSSYDVMNPPANPNSTYGTMVYKLDFNATVDVILQNANALKENVSEIHPWHLHGHDFWVLGYGEGLFSEQDKETFNLENPPLRNSVVVFPYGWTAIRFVADNPGVWAFHCHIEPHWHMGMGVVFAEGVERVGNIPSDAFACGLMRRIMD